MTMALASGLVQDKASRLDKHSRISPSFFPPPSWHICNARDPCQGSQSEAWLVHSDFMFLLKIKVLITS